LSDNMIKKQPPPNVSSQRLECMKKIKYQISFLVLCFLSFTLSASASTTLSITGEIKQPLTLSIEDLNNFQTLAVQLNEVMKDGTYKGAFIYKGVSLRTLLDKAGIEKKVKSISKDIDVAIKVRNSDGKEVALSWGEVYYRNSGDIIIATSATPIMPHKSCASCNKVEFYKPYMDQLDRKITFPKLVMGSDQFADRSIEGIVSIEIINTVQEQNNKQDQNNKSAASEKLYSPSFKITGLVKKDMKVTDISKYPRKERRIIHMGEGKGFHGVSDYSGASFQALLNKAGVNNDLATVFIISAPDGYRSLFSYGEIFLNRVEESIIIADKINGKAIDENGKFFLVPSEDLMSDRDVKSVEKVEVLKLK
jgi:DMSO/TMAO reductase YedYZ molybdopterin-dependent catalytic subunit